jgi:hypothetical protein
MGQGVRDEDTTRRSGVQWAQGLLGGLATLLGSLAGGLTLRTTGSWWITVLVVAVVVVGVMLAGRPLLSRR